MRIAVGNDHRGLALKNDLVPKLRAAGHDVVDLGVNSDGSVDYPDYAGAVARKVAAGEVDRGLLMCGTGIGMAIAANKIPGVRATIIPDEATVEMSRKHNDINVLCLGEKQQAGGVAERIVTRFLATEFEGGRHAARVGKITALESKSGGCS